jgi:hypothetical protein
MQILDAADPVWTEQHGLDAGAGDPAKLIHGRV